MLPTIRARSCEAPGLSNNFLAHGREHEPCLLWGEGSAAAERVQQLRGRGIRQLLADRRAQLFHIFYPRAVDAYHANEPAAAAARLHAEACTGVKRVVST